MRRLRIGAERLTIFPDVLYSKENAHENEELQEQERNDGYDL